MLDLASNKQPAYKQIIRKLLMGKNRSKFSIENCIAGKEFKDEFHKWNFILINQRLEAVQPGKSTIVEQRAQAKHKKKGLPKWAKGQYYACNCIVVRL